MRTATTALALFVFWCVIVPPHGVLDLLVGAVGAAGLARATRSFFADASEPFFSVIRPSQLPRFALRMARRIVASAWQVLRIVADPRLPVAPELLEHTVIFQRDAARVAFANAISLTPGTLTVDVRGDVFLVHCLDPALAHDLLDGSLARDVERLFGDAP